MAGTQLVRQGTEAKQATPVQGSSRIDAANITGRQKAAILCMTLGTEGAAKITQRLSHEDAETISYEIARLDHVPADVTEAVLTEWLGLMIAVDSAAVGGMDYAREMLEAAYGSVRGGQIFRRIQNQLEDTAGLSRLRKVDPQHLGNICRNEHPQTIALLLTHLEPQHTAAVLKEIDPVLGSEVVFRMARMNKVSPDMLQLIERSIGSEAELGFQQGLSASGGPETVAAVLNLTSATLEKALLEGVAERDPELSERIKNLMFVFEDVGSLDDRSLQRLLREVDVKQLALALKAASEELRTRIASCMSQRAMEALKEEMEFMGPVRLRDVELAQTALVAQVRALEESGEIIVGSSTDELVS